MHLSIIQLFIWTLTFKLFRFRDKNSTNSREVGDIFTYVKISTIHKCTSSTKDPTLKGTTSPHD